jgi:hypothetical protein
MDEGQLLAARIGGVAVGFPLLAWVFGSAVLGRFTRLDREERFAASFGLGFAAVALCAFLVFVLHAPQPYFNLGAGALMLGTALWCRLTTEDRPADGAPFPWPLAAVFALAYVHLLCLQALLPAYRGGYWFFDWWMHYNEAQIFVGDEAVTTTWANGYTLASRTPLFNLATAFIMGIAGHGFDTYQMASAATNICFVLPLYLLVRDLFGRRAAWLALLLAPLNLWMLHNAWFTWSKMLAAYYVILALHLYLQSLRHGRADPARQADYFFCFAVFALLAYMTHQSTFFYVLPLLPHAAVMAVRERAIRPRLRALLAPALLALAVAGPWYAWLAGTLGTDKIIHSTPITLGDDSATFRPAAIAKWMGFNIGVSVVPVGVGEAFFTEVPPDVEGPPWAVEVHRGEWFELTPASLDSLRAAGLPDEVAARLDALKEKEFDTREQFLSKLADDLDGEELARYRDLVVEQARHERRWFLGPPSLVGLHLGLTQLYFSLLTGAITLSLSVFLLATAVRRVRRGPALPAAKVEPAGRAAWVAVWLFLIVGTLGGAFLHPGKIPWGIAHSAVFPSAVVLAALAWGLLSRAGRTAVTLVCCGMALEFFLMFWSHWWLLFHDPDILQPRSSAVGPRERWVCMLNETLGSADWPFLVGAIVVQAALVVLLLWSVRRPAETAAEGMT